MIEDSYASVVVSMILNGRPLLMMFLGVPAAILGPAAAVAGSKDNGTSLHVPCTRRWSMLICAFSTDDHGNRLGKKKRQTHCIHLKGSTRPG